MALIKCPECGREVSDKAKSCPQCGHPLRWSINVVPAVPVAILVSIIIVNLLLYLALRGC